jgi:hypothetical protein
VICVSLSVWRYAIISSANAILPLSNAVRET